MTSFCLSSKTYKNKVFEGFSRLQQSDEFVDMTLAAEGHLVKVHKTLIALASPFLKEMLRSAPCQHPVLFLNNVSHEVLCFILEYIYTGEVNIPSDKVKTFLNVAQSLHISGLSNIIPPRDKNVSKKKEATHVSLDPGPPPGIKACITLNENDFNLQVQPNAESSSNEAENGQTVSESATVLPVSEENNQLLRPIDFNSGSFNNTVAINIGGNDIDCENNTQDTMSNMDVSNTVVSANSDTIPIPMIIDGQLQQLHVKPLFNMTNEGTINNAESSNNEAENEHTGCRSAANLPTLEENNQRLRPIDGNNGTFNNSVAMNISGNNTGQDTMSNIDISNTLVGVNNDTIPIPMIIDGRLQQIHVKPLFNMTNEGTVYNAESSNNEAENEHTGCKSATSLPALEESNQLLRPIDVNNGTFSSSVAINISGNNTGQDTMSNMDISNTLVSVNNDTIPIPITIGGKLQQLYAKPFFNMADKETVNASNISNSNQTTNYPTDFSNLFNIASNLPKRHDLPGNITITELSNCNEVATTTTNEITEVVENQEQSDATVNKDPGSVLYTISNRGSLQIIMNRFMYYTHYQREGGRKRRWRCIEYRSKHCVATFDTSDGDIVSRKHQHCHPNHDKKIWQKVTQNKIFNSIKMAEDVMKKKQKMPEPVVLSDSESSENK